MITILFLMHERGKGSESFWWPFIRTLPVPGTIMDWCEEELQELQHDQLTVRCLSRSGRLRLIYENMFMHDLAPRYPLVFSHESTADNALVEPSHCWWDFEHFKFAHGTIQARAFGRRLPWTALVPFADLLVYILCVFSVCLMNVHFYSYLVYVPEPRQRPDQV